MIIRGLTAAVGVPLLVLTACSDPSLGDTDRDESGEIVDAGDVGVQRLQVGDCLVMPDSQFAAESLDDTVAVTDYPAVPCSRTHNGEVVLVDSTYYEDYSEDWPGSDKLLTLSSVQACIDALDEYTGTVYEESTFDVSSMVPGKDGWETVHDRELVCIGVTVDVDNLEVLDTTGSIAAE